MVSVVSLRFTTNATKKKACPQEKTKTNTPWLTRRFMVENEKANRI